MMPEPPRGSVVMMHGPTGTAIQRFYYDGLWHPAGSSGVSLSWVDVLKESSRPVFVVHMTVEEPDPSIEISHHVQYVPLVLEQGSWRPLSYDGETAWDSRERVEQIIATGLLRGNIYVVGVINSTTTVLEDQS